MNHYDFVFCCELHIFLETMTTVAMVTMATMEIGHFSPQNYVFDPSVLNDLHEVFSMIYVHIGVPNQPI